MGKLQDKIAVVTGAGRGIGKDIAMRFASEGAKVAVISRTEANSQSAADAINAMHPGAARAYSVDVADTTATGELGKQILADFDHVDILVNNAGVTKDGLSMRMSPEDWDTVIETNLKGAFNFYQGVVRAMMKQRSGRIVNIASVSGLMGNAGQANYAASKAGLIANAVAPGFISTDMTEVLSEQIKTEVVKQIPVGKFGEGEDIAAAVAFLASGEAKYITGQTLSVDGGMVMM
jgi:3-oxoacyl-[acyl-carrier protein] reductase